MPEVPEPRATGGLPAWKKALFSLIVFLLFFGGLELVLLAVGVAPVLYDEDPFVGFSSRIPLFVEREATDGSPLMVTAPNKLLFFNRQQFPRRKPPGSYRIFCVGGSTTHGRPYDDATSFCGWLRELLAEADPSREWEVINGGGISYASYRVALLMEELVEYGPDLFIIYSGHNEFLERRTYSELIEAPAPLRGLTATLSHTRIYSALRRTLRGSGSSSPRALRDELPGEVEALLDKSVGPDAYRRDDVLHDQVLAHYRFNLARMIDIARSAEATALLVTPASNLRSSAPFKSENRGDLEPAVLTSWQALYAEARAAREAGRTEQALAAADRATAIDDRHPHLQFLRGQLLLSQDRFDEARVAFTRARDEDVCPLRAVSAVVATVAEVAAQRDVPIVDFVARVAERSEHRIPGENLFLDHVHPTIEANRLLAVDLFDALARQGVVRPPASWGDGAIDRVRERVEARIDPAAHGHALKNLAKVLGWAGKLEESRALGQRAVELLPDDAEAHSNLAKALTHQGRSEEAEREFKLALELQPTNARTINELGSLYAELGDTERAETQYRRALEIDPGLAAAHHNRGLLRYQQRRFDLAVESHRRAVEIDPNYAEAYKALGGSLAANGELQQAVEPYTRATTLQPDYAEAHSDLGTVLRRLGQLDEAEQRFRRAILLDPGLSKAHSNLGLLRASRGNLEEAREQFEAAIRADADDARPRVHLARLLLRQGDGPGARRSFEQALSIDPELPDAHYYLGHLLQTQGELAAATAHFRRALQLDLEMVLAANALAWILATAADVDTEGAAEALRLAQRAAAATHHKQPQILGTLAAAHAATGRFDEAVRWQTRALELTPAAQRDAMQRLLDLYRSGKPYRRR